MQTVWVSCDGESPHDRESVGPVEIYPQHGAPAYYYPYENKDGYLSPVMAVHFKNPKCEYLWYKGIIVLLSFKKKK